MARSLQRALGLNAIFFVELTGRRLLLGLVGFVLLFVLAAYNNEAERAAAKPRHAAKVSRAHHAR